MSIDDDDVRIRRCADARHDGVIPAERNRWFAGKYMAARDFALDPEYLRGHQLLHNRLLHGQGVVCGLTVHPHPREECRDGWVVVRAGIGIDCHGREVVLREDTAFRLPDAPDAAATAGGQPATRPELPGDAREEGRGGTGQPLAVEQQEETQAGEAPRWSPYAFVLCLRYDEQPVEPVPVLFPEDACTPGRAECNRVRDGATLVIHTPRAVCWGDHSRTEPPCRNDCDDRLPGPGGSCLTPDCRCGDVVALALIDPARPDEPRGLPFTIDQDRRRHLPTPGNQLTHISSLNWEHGGTVRLEDLRDPEKMDQTLEIQFDRLLREGGTGIDDFTFIVEYSNFQEGLEFLPSDPDFPRVVDGYRAVFRIEDSAFGRRLNIANNRIRVTLKCDFIIDCRGNPVDGNHLHGARPTGNGTPGGVFESWFTVV